MMHPLGWTVGMGFSPPAEGNASEEVCHPRRGVSRVEPRLRQGRARRPGRTEAGSWSIVIHPFGVVALPPHRQGDRERRPPGQAAA
jgi:hypothetical protein